ncbi:MAG: hypothetical protein M3Z37_04290 [Candidatus Eremiobacteraeota bacterium]|nr:hypothetical protein [Candidatus Eremiobacteraeota bacterium]
MPISRKSFLGSTVIATSAALAAAHIPPASAADAPDAPDAPAGRAPVHFKVLKPGDYDHAGMMRKLSAATPHKQVFESVSPLVVAPGVASIYIHMQNAMNAYETSFGYGRGKLATLAVLIGPSIIFGLNDAMWKKYNFGAAMKLDPTNSYYRAGSNLDMSASPDDPNGIYQDWSGQAVLKRGGSFMVCHNATTAVAAMFAGKMGLQVPDVLAEFKANLLPGFMLVPAGVATVQLAQENGWKLYAII